MWRRMRSMTSKENTIRGKQRGKESGKECGMRKGEGKKTKTENVMGNFGLNK
jgi:hypothetical protein